MEDGMRKFYPSSSVALMLPKEVVATRPLATSGDQNTYTIKLADSDSTVVFVFATLPQMVEFAGALERFVHTEMAYLESVKDEEVA